MTIAQLLLLNIGAVVTAFGGIFLKRLSQESLSFGFSGIYKLLLNTNLWLGGICYVLPILIWAYLLRSIDLTKLQPMLAIVYIYSAVLGFFLLGEEPTLLRIVGITVVIVGVILVGNS